MNCKYGHVTERETFQEWLSAANPQWKEYADDLEATNQRPRTNPDGDVSLPPLSEKGVNFLYRLTCKASRMTTSSYQNAQAVCSRENGTQSCVLSYSCEVESL